MQTRSQKNFQKLQEKVLVERQKKVDTTCLPCTFAPYNEMEGGPFVVLKWIDRRDDLEVLLLLLCFV